MTGPGLCGHCRHARRIRSDRGSLFWLCQLAAEDRRFERYPRLPVLECEGFEADGDRRQEDGGGGPANPGRSTGGNRSGEETK